MTKPSATGLWIFASAMLLIFSYTAHAQVSAPPAARKITGTKPVYVNPSPPAPAPAAAPARKPLMVIRFNQKRVYFDRTLMKAVESAEKTKPGIHYYLVSYLPSAAPSTNKGKLERIDENAGDNIREIIKTMQNYGVPSSRIHTLTQDALPGMTSQEVMIFVN